jgi:transposase InsO family protein
MTGNKELLSCLDSSISSDITLGNDHLVKVQGKGTVPILTKQNVKKDICNVYHVPDLKHNLLSVGQLIEKGYKVLFEGASCKIYDRKPSRKLISEIYMTPNRMFPLTLRTANLSQPYAQSASTLNETMVWHTRFGHLPFQSLSLLQKNSMVKGLPIFKEQIPPCESCILGKHKRTSFPQSSNQAKQHLELVHTDLCGPMQTESIGGSFYFLTFIDDFSRKIWIYFLRHKSETFTKFKEFKAEAEKQSGKFLKVLRSDGGGEYNSREFANFCKSQGIIMQATTRYTPQQNGVAERKNQTIMNMARTLLKEKCLSNTFWAEAVACSVYLLNRSPTTSLQMKVPQEAWSGTKLNVAHLRTFGCIAYAHIPSELRKKLDDRSEKCIFTGYSETSKAYRLYNPITKKLILSRDVQFLENQFWNDSENQQVDSQNPLLPSSENTENSEQQVPQTSLPRLQVQGQPDNSQDNSTSSRESFSEPQNQRTRSLREIHQQLDDFEQHNLFALMSCQPTSFKEAAKEPHWVQAMNQEIDSIEKNKTWDLVDLPTHKKSIGVKWVYKTKLNEKGQIEKHKARLVAKGFSQQPGTDYGETFAPVARLDTVRTLLAIAAQHKWQVYQMDVKSAFLNGFLEEEVYVDQPPGFEVQEHPAKVYRLKKALYGLKQAPRAWYNRIDTYLIKSGFNRSQNEPTLYTKTDQHGKILIVCLYVDDMIYTGNLELTDFKHAMQSEFEMTDLGIMKYFLGIEVHQSAKGIFVCQQKYAADIIKRFRMEGCNPAETPIPLGTKLSKNDEGPTVDSTLYKSLVGSLLYLTATRPDIMYAASLVSRFMESPKDSHWKMAKRILRYVAGTINFGLWYTKSDSNQLSGYTDSDFAGSLDDRKSTSGYVFQLGTNLISWASKKQPIVSISSAEAEYVAATSASCQAVWLRRLLKDMSQTEKDPTPIFCDNTSAIALSKNHVFHKKSKHIDTRFHFIRELVNNGDIALQFCGSRDQLADIFTKPLGKSVFDFQRQHLGIVSADDCNC